MLTKSTCGVPYKCQFCKEHYREFKEDVFLKRFYKLVASLQLVSKLIWKRLKSLLDQLIWSAYLPGAKAIKKISALNLFYTKIAAF